MLSLRQWAATVAVALGCVASLVVASPAHASTAGDFSFTGHRGYPSTRHTENTIPSYAAAWKAGAPSVEADVRLTRDQQFVLMHDQSLGRTTTCKGDVDAHMLAWIQAHCRGKVHHERIPSLGGYLQWAQTHAMNVIVEIKTDPLHRWTPDDFTRIDQLITHDGLMDRVHLMSFSAPLLQMAKSVDVSFFVDSIITVNRPWSVVEDAATWTDGVQVDPSQLTSDRVAELHGLGVQVYGRVTNSATDWAHLVDVGADGLLIDDVSTYRSWETNWMRTHAGG